MDALEDLLSRFSGYPDKMVSDLMISLKTAEYTVARSYVFKAIRYTPLEYAILFSPSSVETLLAEGVDAAAEPALAYAVRAGRTDLIKVLVDKGAEVNAKDRWGRTALHWACYYCRYSTFFELVLRAAGRIDWNGRTQDQKFAQDALALFELGVSEGLASYLTSVEIIHFRMAIVTHMNPVHLRVAEDYFLYVPGAFPG